MPRKVPYGEWKSPITAELAAAVRLSLITVAVDGQEIYWVESRPLEGGRQVVVRRSPDRQIRDVTPGDYSVRSTVHEYGGGALAVRDQVVYFVNYSDQQIYRQRIGEAPRRLTSSEGCRYADLVFDSKRHRLICVREDHRGQGEAVNAIVGVAEIPGHADQILVSGNDFYHSPRISPDGSKLTYLTWNHPNMPWDGCELWVVNVDLAGALGAPQLVAGGPAESICQPEWSPDGVLHYVSDVSGWWNLYRWDGTKSEPLHPLEAEFGRSHFQFDLPMYGFVSPWIVLCSYTQDGLSHLAILDTRSKEFRTLETTYTNVSHVKCGEGFAVFIAGSPLLPSGVVQVDTQTAKMQTLRYSFVPPGDRAELSVPEALDFPTSHGLHSHAFWYRPQHREFEGPQGQKPPLLVCSHGGPTSAASTTLLYDIQFWTSRGFAVLDVNYGGSTGYGRAYRQRLNGQLGVVDVDDCCNGALQLSETGNADRHRLAIRGRSAGGYTTLACLAFRNDVFSAGASYYGLADLERFAVETHKFESRYLTRLVGPYPERRDLYHDRSPIHFLPKFNCPVILFQGNGDRVVPPSQARMMFEALRAKGLPTSYLLFRGEQHGFRQAGNIQRAFEAELYFYSRVFHFTPADPIEPIAIENL